jgi:hypothetical protein
MNLLKHSIYGALLMSVLTSTVNGSTTIKEYYAGDYSLDHWSLQPKELNNAQVVALAYFKDAEYAIHMNPTDKRGYRSIVSFIKKDEMLSTLNRDYSTKERIGLGLTLQLVAEAYSRILPISQTSVAGNNAHAFDSQTGITYIGKSTEPSMLHGHVYGRGNPEACYIDDIKLDGPIPGLNFDMMGKTSNEPGNDAKVKWKEGDMEKVAAKLKREIEMIKEEYEEQGLVIITK